MSSIIENKKAYFDYEIIDKWEAGIKLIGHEVKSVKAGKASIVGSYVKIIDGEAYIIGMKIDEYQNSSTSLIDERTRTRKLLLNKTELKKLIKQTEEKGLTIVPLSLYIKNRWLKVSIGVGRGKKKADKRETLKKRTIERDIRREYSTR
jgi:SsrA-binding protein